MLLICPSEAYIWNHSLHKPKIQLWLQMCQALWKKLKDKQYMWFSISGEMLEESLGNFIMGSEMSGAALKQAGKGRNRLSHAPRWRLTIQVQPTACALEESDFPWGVSRKALRDQRWQDTWGRGGWPEGLLERLRQDGRHEGDVGMLKSVERKHLWQIAPTAPPYSAALCFLALKPLVARMWVNDLRWTELR